MLREVRMALLEADVALPVVRDFVARVKEKAPVSYTHLDVYKRQQSNSYALDYKLKPADKPWLDLNVKIYGGDTNVKNYTEPNYPRSVGVGDFFTTDAAKIRESVHFEYWNSAGTGTCETGGYKSSYATDLCTHYGIGKETRLRTRTYGLQVDNTSRFMFGKSTLLSAHYGIDVYKRQSLDTRKPITIGVQIDDRLPTKLNTPPVSPSSRTLSLIHISSSRTSAGLMASGHRRSMKPW